MVGVGDEAGTHAEEGEGCDLREKREKVLQLHPKAKPYTCTPITPPPPPPAPTTKCVVCGVM